MSPLIFLLGELLCGRPVNTPLVGGQNPDPDHMVEARQDLGSLVLNLHSNNVAYTMYTDYTIDILHSICI